MSSEHIEIIVAMISRILGVELNDVEILDLGYGNPTEWDSLANFAILTAIESEFGVNFTMEELVSVRDVRAILSKLKQDSK
jgi:acyl carrier protein